MALNQDAIFAAGKGYIFTAEVDTAPPTPAQIAAFTNGEGTQLPSGWTNFGHTAREELPEFGFDGGDIEPRGTWQMEAVREVVTEATVDYVTFQAHQFDPQVLEAYYGSDNVSDNAGVGGFGIASINSKQVYKALLIVIVDGNNKIALYAPNVSMRREDAITLEVDEFAVLPIRATFLAPPPGSENNLLEWIPGVAPDPEQ